MSAALELAETPNETENIKIAAKVISSVFLIEFMSSANNISVKLL